jgi:hypothetical protein
MLFTDHGAETTTSIRFYTSIRTVLPYLTCTHSIQSDTPPLALRRQPQLPTDAAQA